MESHRNDLDLVAELRALRPTPRPEFTAELDARAAAGFPSRSRRGGALGQRARSAIGRATDRFRIAPRRLLAPGAGAALAAVAVATGIVVSSENGAQPDRSQPVDIHLLSRGPASGEALSATTRPPSSADKTSAQSRFFDSATTEEAGSSRNDSFNGSLAAGAAPSSGPYASRSERRDVERSAEMVLGTDASEIRDAAGKVFSTVHAYDGIVLRSSIEDGAEGDAGAEFELLIPSAKLGDALASFSRIAEVRSRHEATADVTAKTIGLGERLQDARATVKGLLGQLAGADTEAERVVAKAELHSERLRVATLRSRLASLERRTNLSHVSLRIESGEASATGEEENGGWGIGDALDDAGHILEVAAGVALVGLAILSPIALLVLLAWLARRTRERRSRERALD